MANIRGLSFEKKKDNSKLLEQSGSTSGTAVQKMDDLMQKIKQESASSSASSSSSGSVSVASIILFKNGFQVGGEDGEFFDLQNPKNQQMVDEMLAGDMPVELEQKLRDRLPPSQKNVGVDFVNRMQEMYVPPKPKFDFAHSVGMQLGSSAGVASAASFAQAKPRAIEVDEKQPSTTIQIVLADKSRIRQKFNLTNTVLDIYQHVQSVSKVNAAFDLLNGFPPKPLSDPSVTIQEAGLSGASLTQKL